MVKSSFLSRRCMSLVAVEINWAKHRFWMINLVSWKYPHDVPISHLYHAKSPNPIVYHYMPMIFHLLVGFNPIFVANFLRPLSRDHTWQGLAASAANTTGWRWHRPTKGAPVKVVTAIWDWGFLGDNEDEIKQNMKKIIGYDIIEIYWDSGHILGIPWGDLLYISHLISGCVWSWASTLNCGNFTQEMMLWGLLFMTAKRIWPVELEIVQSSHNSDTENMARKCQESNFSVRELQPPSTHWHGRWMYLRPQLDDIGSTEWVL